MRFTAKLGERGVEVPGDPKAEFGGARAPVAGIGHGDVVEVAIERDDAPREVEVPEALARALAADPEAQSAFEALAFTHRKEYAQWIAEAKKEETRTRRVTRAMEMLRGGAKHP